MHLLAALAFALPAQVAPNQGPAPGRADRAPEPRQVALAVVGDDLILMEEIDAIVRNEATRGRIPANDAAAFSRLASEILSDRIDELLKINAGRNIGFDKATTEAFADRAFERELEAQGGAADMAAYFAEVGVSPEQYKQYNEERLYLDQWNLITTGRIPPHLGRPKVDRYVRPGQRWASYQYLAKSEVEFERELVGALPERLELQRMVLSFGTDEEKAAATQLSKAILQGLEAGADFGELSALHGHPQPNEGRMEPASLAYIREIATRFHGSDSLARWAADAEPGDVSEVQFGASANWPGGKGLLIYRLVDLHPPTEADPYMSYEMQESLDALAKRQMDGNRTRLELARVKRHTFIWPRDAGAGPEAEEAEGSVEARIEGSDE